MSMLGVFALMSILSSTTPFVYIQNTHTAIDYSGKIIHTKKQGGRVGRCSAEPDTRRKPPEGAAPNGGPDALSFRSRSNGHSTLGPSKALGGERKGKVRESTSAGSMPAS